MDYICINVTERGPYVIQLCPELQKYMIWNRNTHKHIMDDQNTPRVFLDKHEAISVAESAEALEKIKQEEDYER